ncbi:hypothetical protein R9X50_00079900 [Acrodontium crateriforme]|uniref:Uncharacterized protein n=1 Tax=Acrodontium crateriforme TaxID=150365 RepID=A0AAQ3M194_9PEZI|nr:hypothetical protein R9X50_00079900 [Acrodontium crateriforme]
MANTTHYSNDNQFGPVIPADFDFTRLFEDTILSIGPSALFLCIVPFRLLFLRNKPRKVVGGVLHYVKLVTFTAFITLQVVCLALWASPRAFKSNASIAAASLTVATAIGLGALSIIDHFRSIRPSSIINAYILLSLPMDIASVRTLWTRGGSYELAAASTSTVAIKALILIVEAMEKRGILSSEYAAYSPESTSSIYSKSLFWWINPLLLHGFKNILSDEDIFPLDAELKTEAVQQTLQTSWANTQVKTKKNAFLWRTLWAVKWTFLKAVFPRIVLTFLSFMQPFLINAVINFLQAPVNSLSTNVGWGLTAAYGLVYIGLAIAKGAFNHQIYRLVTLGRGVLVTIIYRQTVDLNLTSVDESAAITLMSADVERICDFFELIHTPWSSIVDAAVGVYLLEQQVQLAALGPVLLSVVLSISVLWMASRFAAKFQGMWVACIQTRIDATAKMLGDMKAVKMLGLTDMMRSLVANLREVEIKQSKRFRRLIVLQVGLGKACEILAPGITFAAFVIISKNTQKPLEVAQAYLSLSIVSLIATPICRTIQSLPQLISAISCFDRIQDFLNLPAQRDHRLKNESTVSRASSPFSNIESGSNIKLSQLPFSDVNTVIDVQNASFSWDDSKDVIKDVSFQIMENTFNFVVGPVGSGKSTLLKGLVGETPSTKGFVYSKILKAGFVDQTSWIQSGSFQNNVLGMSDYDQDWYNKVIYACCLQDDIAILPKGDQTQVGSAGISLSGGQKQRLALARAVYSKQKLLIMDDCFSGLDATTEERIFNRLLGKGGLLRRNKITVILATHAAHRLSYSNNILVLSSDGKLIEEGTFGTLMETGQYLNTLTTKYSTEEEYQEKHQPGNTTDSFRNPANKDEIAKATADATRSVGEWSIYVYYFRACGWTNTLLFLAGMMACGVFIKLPDVWITFWTTAVSTHGNGVNNFYLGFFLLFEVLAALLLSWVAYACIILMTTTSANRLHKTVLDTVMAAPLLFFSTTDTGTTLNRFSQDMALCDAELPFAYLEVCASIILGAIQAALMCLSSGKFAATFPAVVVVMWVIQKYYLRTSRQVRLLDLEAKAPLYSHFGETLQGLVTIRSFGWSEDFEAQNARLLDTSQRPFYLLFCIQRWLGLVLDLIVAGLTVVLMILIVTKRGTINPGFAGVALVNINGLNISLTQLIKEWTKLETSIGAVARVKSFSAQTISENLPTEDKALPDDLEWPSKGGIEISNLWAGYKPDVPVVQNISLSILPGQKVGFCGPSGSGKSSVISTIFRMLEISSGSITIDSMDISNIPRQDLRKHINAIPQDSYFFKGTIRMNVDPMDRHTDAERQAALEKVKLWSTIEGKGGLDAAADSEMFSHGQRQLFCLARAILHPSKIVVLDEVTSSVDLATDEIMQKIIREEFDDCTIIAVAHRLDTILDFDMIATLEAGRLVEFDTPNALMARDSAFKALYESH